MAQPNTLIAVDVGNSSAKWGRFTAGELVATARLALADPDACDAQARLWSLRPHEVAWSVASVNSAASQPVLDWIHARGAAVLLLDDRSLLPLRIEVDEPERVGIDRLLDAVAANERRPRGKPAIVIDCGSAVTVNAISPAGSFLGGAIAPGMRMSARALHEHTASLPLVDLPPQPPALGKCTAAAIASGVFWGWVGAARELVARMRSTLSGPPAIYLTGGDAELIAPHLGEPAELLPDLTLRGIYLATEHVRSLRAAHGSGAAPPP